MVLCVFQWSGKIFNLRIIYVRSHFAVFNISYNFTWIARYIQLFRFIIFIIFALFSIWFKHEIYTKFHFFLVLVSLLLFNTFNGYTINYRYPLGRQSVTYTPIDTEGYELQNILFRHFPKFKWQQISRIYKPIRYLPIISYK